ncbi:hypothetical protein [Paenibacillus sp. NRS-1781]|uniref:hypothetical protein n=1 Tax=Paenibacillus sp. NRS-1781 TaxID=3233905 RepID=UPI003D282BCD
MTEKKTTTPAEAGNEGKYVLKFSKPFKFEDQEPITELVFDWDKVNGRKLISLSERLALNDMDSPIKAVNMKFQAAVCAEAAGVPFQLIEELPGGVFGRATAMAQSFLLGLE